MVRCEEFYKRWEKRRNFCNKSENVAKKVDDYIDYVKRNGLLEYGGYRISNCALDPLMNIEDIKGGHVHKVVLKRLKTSIRKKKILPEKVTRRFCIELINEANNKVDPVHKLDRIPYIRCRMRGYEHSIAEISYEVRDTFDTFKNDINAKNNNEAMKVMLEMCIRNIDDVIKIKEELDKKKESEEHIVITT